MANFTVYPAIDLRRGQVVRLTEGDPARQTSYSADPAAAARRWLEAGARWLHVVNLDGAFGEAAAENLSALAAVLAEADRAGAPVQFGGGLRSMEALQRAFDLGVARAVLGTAAVEQPGLVENALSRWGAGRIAAGLDARGETLKVRGWRQPAPLSLAQAARRLAAAGLRTAVHTDISRDGLQAGLNVPASAALAASSGLEVIASGGLAGWDDLRAAAAAGLAGVIAGRALYEGRFEPSQLFGFGG